MLNTMEKGCLVFEWRAPFNVSLNHDKLLQLQEAIANSFSWWSPLTWKQAFLHLRVTNVPSSLYV